MGLLDRFRKRKQVLSRVEIAFPSDFESSWLVSVVEEPPLPEDFNNWVWDLFYAKTLYELGINPISQGLRAQLEAWAEQWVIPCFGAIPLPPEGLTVDDDLRLVSSRLETGSEAYVLEVISGKPSLRNPKGWPLIQSYLPSRGYQNRMASAVLALAQHLLARDEEAFGRMLPIHILAMRKYYREVEAHDKLRAVPAAPVFAVNTEMEVGTDISNIYDDLLRTGPG